MISLFKRSLYENAHSGLVFIIQSQINKIVNTHLKNYQSLVTNPSLLVSEATTLPTTDKQFSFYMRYLHVDLLKLGCVSYPIINHNYRNQLSCLKHVNKSTVRPCPSLIKIFSIRLTLPDYLFQLKGASSLREVKQVKWCFILCQNYALFF